MRRRKKLLGGSPAAEERVLDDGLVEAALEAGTAPAVVEALDAAAGDHRHGRAGDPLNAAGRAQLVGLDVGDPTVGDPDGFDARDPGRRGAGPGGRDEPGAARAAGLHAQGPRERDLLADAERVRRVGADDVRPRLLTAGDRCGRVVGRGLLRTDGRGRVSHDRTGLSVRRLDDQRVGVVAQVDPGTLPPTAEPPGTTEGPLRVDGSHDAPAEDERHEEGDDRRDERTNQSILHENILPSQKPARTVLTSSVGAIERAMELREL